MRGVFFAFGLFIASQASAQVSKDMCHAVWDRAIGIVPDALTQAEVVAEGPDCVALDVRLANDAGSGVIAADRIAWSGQGLEGFAEDMTPPRALVLRAEGLSAIALTGDPIYDYVRRAMQSQRKVAVQFEARWDALTGRLVLDAFDIDFPGENRVRVTARAEYADLSSVMALAQSIEQLALSELTVDVTSNGLFEEVLLEPLLRIISQPGASPENSMSWLIETSTQAISEVPGEVLGGPTKAALIEALQSLPAPEGALRLTVSADPPLPISIALAARLGTDMALQERMAGLRIGAQFEPTATLP